MLYLATKVPRNAALLVTLLVLILAAPLLPHGRSWFVLELMFDSILIAGVYSVGNFKLRWAFLLLTVVTLGVRWAELLSGLRGMDVGALALTFAWLAFAVTLIVYHLFQHRDVDVDAILGSIVTYLLAAVAFAMLFQMLALLRPDAFSGLADDAHLARTKLADTMLYYSLVCITTMGYGDIVPVGPLARPLSVLAGVFGQLYLAVMIARLVGLHIARQGTKTE